MRPTCPSSISARHAVRGRNGFALPIVLLLLILATATALAAASMATRQVRSALDLGTSVMSLHAAEGGASWIVNGFSDASLTWADDDGLLSGNELLQVGVGLPVSAETAAPHGEATWWVESMDFSGDEVTMRVHGQVAQVQRQRTVEVVYARGEGGTTSPFANAVVGCDGVTLSGSGAIDSWDSRSGPYSAALARANAHVGTLSPTGDVVLSGSSPIRGNVVSARDIRVTGGAQVAGSYHAVRNIAFQGNPSCPQQDVKAGGVVAKPGAWWCGNPQFDGGDDVSPPAQSCDPLDIVQLMADSMNHYRPSDGVYDPWTHTGWRPNPVHFGEDVALSSFSIGPGAHPVTVNTGDVDVLFVNGNFALTSSSILHLQNPSVMGGGQELKIFVNGNLTAAGASQLRIDPGVTVRFYVSGTVSFTGGHGQTILPSVDLNPGGPPRILPTMAIYSSHVGGGPGNSAGVSVGGNSPLSATVYAPLATVSVVGSSELFGAVRGRSITVSGNARIHYDEALGLMGGAPTAGGASSRVVSWNEVR